MITSQVIQFGDNVDTDQIIGAQYLKLSSIEEMVPYTFEYYEQFVKDFQPGNIIVGGYNFGCGSSREQAPAVLKMAGVSVIVAKSFARIFYRNAINLGIPVVVCKDVDQIHPGNLLEIDLKEGFIFNKTTTMRFHIEPFPKFIQNILDHGGIAELVRNRVCIKK